MVDVILAEDFANPNQSQPKTPSLLSLLKSILSFVSKQTKHDALNLS